MAIKVTISKFDIKAGTTDTVYVAWKFSGATAKQKKQLDKFVVKWKVRYTAKGAWFDLTTTDVNKSLRTAEFKIPEKAYSVNVWINAYSTKHNVKSGSKTKSVYYWKCKSATHTYVVKSIDCPDDIQLPSCSIAGTKFRLSAGPISNSEIFTGTSHIEWDVIKQQEGKRSLSHYSSISSIKNNYAYSEYISLGAGYNYRYRARAYNSTSKKYGNWTEYSEPLYGIPSKPNIISLSTSTSTTIKIMFAVSGVATLYTIEYQSLNKDFDSVSDVSSAEMQESSTSAGSKTKTFYINNLQPGAIYYFRVRAVNSTGESSWSNVKSVVIGSKPSIPTTWSDVYSAILGDSVTLYWTHNSQDGSTMRTAQVRIYVNGVLRSTRTVDNPYIGTVDEDKVQSLTLTLSTANGYSDGDVVTWDVRTKGIYNAYSDWSIVRSITVYQEPTISISARESWLWDTFRFEEVDGGGPDSTTDTNLYVSVLTYPIELEITSGPITQIPLTYHLRIIANEDYESTDQYGEPISIAEGTEVYSGFFEFSSDNPTHSFTTALTINDVMLEDGISYVVKALVYMNSGLSAETEKIMPAEFVEEIYSPQILDVVINEDDWSAMIYPICYYAKDIIDESGEILDISSIDSNDNIEFDESVIMDSDDTLVIGELDLPNVLLDLYRIEANGSYVKINDAPIVNDGSVGIPDPHPALDFARYRIVARNEHSARLSYEDYFAWAVGCSSIVIQWDESWNTFEWMNTDDGDFIVEDGEPLQSAILILPYNIDVSESYSPDVSLVEYIGRNYPVSYYGTQRGQSATWSTEIPAEDTVTLNSLRRLANWMGDVYVREPTGTGYWAHVNVSMSLKHKDVLIPVSLNVQRVEGGR